MINYGYIHSGYDERDIILDEQVARDNKTPIITPYTKPCIILNIDETTLFQNPISLPRSNSLWQTSMGEAINMSLPTPK